jgi:methyl coenzyme M reductase gamma subunit
MKNIKKLFEAIIKFEDDKSVGCPHMERHESFLTDLVKGKKIELDRIMYAKFGDQMYLATIEIDKDHMAYLLVPSSVLFDK